MPDLERPPLIKPRAALRLVEMACGAIPLAMDILAQKIRLGDVRAYAGRLWESRRRNVSDAWDNEPPNVAKRIRVPTSLFDTSLGWHEEVRSWNWKKGRFWITHQSSPPRRTMLKSVRFVEDDVKDLVRQMIEDAAEKKHAGGRPSDREKWDAYWMAVVEMALDGALVDPQFERQGQALNGQIFERSTHYATKRHKEERTLATTRAKVWKKLVLPRLERHGIQPGNKS
jgi:hypothetical protein